MADMWFKRCPQCGTYIKKIDPQESAMCCACGWEEYVGVFYCDVVHTYCTHLDQDDRLALDLPRPHRMSKFRR
jgi:hypothetical protein